MFEFFKKSKEDLTNSEVAFDLKPMYESLTLSQKVRFDNLANTLHFEIHKIATLMDFNFLSKSFLVKKKFHEPEILSPNLYTFYEHDEGLKRRTFEVFYPINEFSSVKTLRHIINQRNPQNDILSMISGEAAIRVIRGDFFNTEENLGNSSAATFIEELPKETQESFLNYCNLLIKKYHHIKAILKKADGNSVSPIKIKESCFVVVNNNFENTFLLIKPDEQIRDIEASKGSKITASVFFSDLKAFNNYLQDGDRDSMVGLCSEAAIRLLSGTNNVKIKYPTQSSESINSDDYYTKAKEYKSHNNTENEYHSNIKNNTIKNIVEKTDKAVHRRVDASVSENKKSIVEKNDRAVHGRAELESNIQNANDVNVNNVKDSNIETQSESFNYCKKEWLGLSIKCPACESKFIVNKTMTFFSHGVRCPQCKQKILI